MSQGARPTRRAQGKKADDELTHADDEACKRDRLHARKVDIGVRQVREDAVMDRPRGIGLRSKLLKLMNLDDRRSPEGDPPPPEAQHGQ